MNTLSQRYQTSLSLLTDLYQITMAYGYWKSGRQDDEAVFHWFYRKNPFKGDFAIACGLQDAVEYLENLKFSDSDIAYLGSLTGSDDKPLFEQGFLDYLYQMEFTCDVDAVPEGTIVFPHEPLIRIKGPLIQAQLIETPLLTIMNFQTLIASKAARIVDAAGNDTILEFGLRRAQGIDGGLSASRAAYIGGCHATSNVLAGKLFDIPVKGTHAHSWVMSFDSEDEAFKTYAEVMPNNCVFLVDTYDTVEGVKKAIKVGNGLRENGYKMMGIRLDSGNLAALSIEARKLLDAAGFEDAAIIASDSLDEYRIAELKDRGAKITIWGVGTRLVSAYDQPALGGVYKLAALRKPNSDWEYRVKLSENPIKVSNPGILQVRRYYQSDDKPFGDMIWNTETEVPSSKIQSFDGRKVVADERIYEDLLQPIFQKGEKVYSLPSIHDIRQRTIDQIQLFHNVNFGFYPVGLEEQLNERKLTLIKTLRQQ
ncbi:MAG: nicotinate phosphoribosyltransferase [Aureispira sp.]|nr:nicotinate phosphoribosyltransferase [Aureispira sp.]